MAGRTRGHQNSQAPELNVCVHQIQSDIVFCPCSALFLLPSELPDALVEQLKPGGRLVIPVGSFMQVSEGSEGEARGREGRREGWDTVGASLEEK